MLIGYKTLLGKAENFLFPHSFRPLKSKLCCKELTLNTRQQNFRLVQIESMCRRHKFARKIKTCFGKGKNIVGKGEMLVTSISPFPTMFSKAFSFRVIKSMDCVVKLNNFARQSRL